MSKPKLVIIGGGIAGLSCAGRAVDTFEVTVLEAETQPGYHSSGRSAAVLIEAYENEVVNELTVPGIDYQLTCGAKPIGALTVADEGHVDQIERYWEQWHRRCKSLARLTAAEALERVPGLRASGVAKAVIERDAMSLDAHGLLENFRKRTLSGGGRLVTGARVDRIEPLAAGWRISWGHDAIDVDMVVNAAGAWGDGIAEMAGVRPLGLEPLRRSAFLVDPGFEAAHWPLVHRVQGDLYFKPEAGLLMVSPADATASSPCDAQPEELDIAIAVDRFQEMTEIKVTRMAQTWAGLRTFLPDQIPAAGFDARADGFFWLVGQGGFGMQTAPTLSEVAARILSGGDHPLAGRLSPERFGLPVDSS